MTATSCLVYKVTSDLESIDHLCINPIDRSKENITPLSLLVGTTVKPERFRV